MDAFVAVLKEVQAANTRALKYQQLSREAREALQSANRAIAAELREIDRRNQIQRIAKNA